MAAYHDVMIGVGVAKLVTPQLPATLFITHPVAESASIHPRYNLLGFSAALAPKFIQMQAKLRRGTRFMSVCSIRMDTLKQFPCAALAPKFIFCKFALLLVLLLLLLFLFLLCFLLLLNDFVALRSKGLTRLVR